MTYEETLPYADKIDELLQWLEEGGGFKTNDEVYEFMKGIDLPKEVLESLIEQKIIAPFNGGAQA